MIRGMTKKIAIPAHETVSKAGDVLETVGMLIVALSLLGGLAVVIAGGTAAILGGVPIGLLVMITAHTKKTSAATAAMFILQSRELGAATELEARTQQ